MEGSFPGAAERSDFLVDRALDRHLGLAWSPAGGAYHKDTDVAKAVKPDF
jgi:hypothetical protein